MKKKKVKNKSKRGKTLIEARDLTLSRDLINEKS